MDKVTVMFIKDNEEIVTRSMWHVPRKDDVIQISGHDYKVLMVKWIVDLRFVKMYVE